jgi:hypothetical protein
MKSFRLFPSFCIRALFICAHARTVQLECQSHFSPRRKSLKIGEKSERWESFLLGFQRSCWARARSIEETAGCAIEQVLLPF